MNNKACRPSQRFPIYLISGIVFRIVVLPVLAIVATSCKSRIDARVVIQESRRVGVAFHTLDGEVVGKSRKMRMAQGSHQAELVLDWQGASREIVSFPMEIPEPGDYVIQLIEAPELSYAHRMPEGTSGFVSSLQGQSIDPRAGIILVPIMALFVAADTAGGAAVLAKGPNQEDHPLHTIWLRLRPDLEGRYGRVLSWKQFDHPLLRESGSDQ